MIDCETRLYINGEWREGSAGERFDVVDPATGEVIATVSDATAEDAQAAVDAAAAAAADWAGRSPRERAEILRKAFDLLTAQEDRFARLIADYVEAVVPDPNGRWHGAK